MSPASWTIILTGSKSLVQANNFSEKARLLGDVESFIGYVLCCSRSSVHTFSGSTIVRVPLIGASFSFCVLIFAVKSK